jgi:hypothetical protein
MTSAPVDARGVNEDNEDEESGAGATAAARRRGPRLRAWTRRLHNYVGLYLLLFLWLFSVSGLVLNHSKWAAARFWEARQESTTERAIHTPAAAGDVAMAEDLTRQLGLVGEIGETKRHPDGARFDVQVVKPGRVYRVEARLDSGRARVTEIRLNAWGVVDALHKFTGVKMDEPARTRDWVMTRVWSLAMDALALGLVVLVVSGLYLWYRRVETRRTGFVALLAGVACCAFFLYGLGA